MDKVSYIPVGIDINYFKKSPRKESIDGIDLKDKFVIISVANMVPVKGIEILIEAFKNLDEQTEKNIELLLVGSYHGEYGQKLIELSEHKSNIHLLGKKNDVRPYITEADVFVIPTLNIGRKEAQGVAPLEAMSMHVPVLASDLDGLRDVMINHKDNLFESGNVEELLKKLLKLYEVKTVPNKIEEHFRLDSMNKSYNELYESIYF